MFSRDQWHQLGCLGGQPIPKKVKMDFFKIKFTIFHAGRANGAAALTYLDSEL